MGRETRIGLLVSLGFVVVFGLVLAELTGLEPSGPAGATAATVTGTDYSHAYPIEDLRMPGGRSARVAQRPAPVAPVAPAQQASVRPQPPTPPQPTPVAPVVADSHRSPDRQYTVLPNDTLIGIARKVYGPGCGKEHRRILEANRRQLTDASSLKVGQTLVIPPLPGASPARAVESAAPAPSTGVAGAAAPVRAPAAAMTRGQRHEQPAWTHTIEANETLQDIALKYYGDDSGGLVQKIINANPVLERISSFQAGMKLTIPR